MSKSIKVLRDQKEEYTEHLFELLNQPLITVFRKIYNEVLKSKDYAKKNVLKMFQKQMEITPEWNQAKIKKVYDDILAENKCGYFPELIKTVYMLTLKIVLLGIPLEKRKKIQIRIPSPESFVHRCLVHVARELWKRPYLLYHESRSIDCQQNMHECELIIRKKLKAVVRETIPIEWVINEFENINSDETIPEPVSESEEEIEEVVVKNEPVEEEEEEDEEDEDEDDDDEDEEDDDDDEEDEEDDEDDEDDEEEDDDDDDEEEDDDDDEDDEDDDEEEDDDEDEDEDDEDEEEEEEFKPSEPEAEAPVPEPEAEAPVPEPEPEAEAPVPEPEPEAPVLEPQAEAEAPVLEAEAPVLEAEAEAHVPEQEAEAEDEPVPELEESDIEVVAPREIVIDSLKKKKKSIPVNAFF
jgi:hypothetical protein